MDTSSVDQLSINTIRFLAVDAVQKANSGHPGMPMGAAPMAYVLWTRFLKHSPANPGWPDRDRFVLSAGHGSMLLYGLLHLTGYNLSLDELKNFRQWGSKTAGHPEYNEAPGVETTTGPLGQGFATGVGMAIAERHMAARFNRPGHELVSHYTYGIVSDGDLMEGISHEAASLAGHLKLGKLIYLYDDNHISIEGRTDIAFTENRLARFAAYGWHVQQVEDGNDLDAIEAAIRTARKENDRPSLIAVRTLIGFGSPNRQDTPKAHGEPLGSDEIRITKENLGWPQGPAFHIPDEVLKNFRQAVQNGLQREEEWTQTLISYRQAFPDMATAFDLQLKGDLPRGWDKDVTHFPSDEKLATRVSSGKILNALAANIPAMMGGSADLAPSNKTYINSDTAFQAGSYGQRNIHFGVREFGMGAILNGMALHGGIIPYGGTFLVFSDYMRPAIRLAALMKQRVIYVFTHDSIGLGEDGPTHQPIEHLASLRAMPGLVVIRPADANETVEAWKTALNNRRCPTALVLSRQGLPTLNRATMAPAGDSALGGYIIKPANSAVPDLILAASGSEVHIALEAAAILEQKNIGIQVVSMPSWEIFDQQNQEYKDTVFPPSVTAKIAIEAGASQGWHRYVGDGGIVIGLDHFGASAPINDLYTNFGITSEQIIKAADKLLK